MFVTVSTAVRSEMGGGAITFARSDKASHKQPYHNPNPQSLVNAAVRIDGIATQVFTAISRSLYHTTCCNLHITAIISYR